MTDRPILFSAPMIRALLEGRKTQTRRVMPDGPDGEWFVDPVPGGGLAWVAPEGAPRIAIRLPVATGDTLWVREAWQTGPSYDDLSPSELGGDEPVRYDADGHVETWGWEKLGQVWGRKRPSMFMPRWASRLTLTITDVRVQRLQDMTEDDAEAEGCVCAEEIVDITSTPSGHPMEVTGDRWRVPGIGDDEEGFEDGVECYANLWNSLNEKRGYGWDANPWVVAYSFTVETRNIDQARAA